MNLTAINSVGESYNTYLASVASQIGVSLETITILMSLVAIWALAWKGVALWKAAKNKSIIWFIILLVINDLGILEILYIFIFSKISSRRVVRKSERINKRNSKKTR
jgi:uncharacterized membrane protein